jgi:hypothetical protein
MRIELTLRGDYAVRAALAITLLDDGRPVSARRIAERMDIPTRFLAHVLTDLVRAGIVVGTPGRKGGQRLAASPIDLLRAARSKDLQRCVLRGGPAARRDLRGPRRLRRHAAMVRARRGASRPRLGAHGEGPHLTRDWDRL